MDLPANIAPPFRQNNPVRLLAKLLGLLLVLAYGGWSRAATFPGNADLTVSDPSGALSWNTAKNALSVQCWFKISIPTGTNLTQNMTILVNGNSGSESHYSYLLRFNIMTGNVEFVAQGTTGGYTNTLIQLPYLDRWYHLAIVQQGAAYTGYVDGRQVFSSSGSVGNTANTSGISIGGWGSGQYLFGEVQEVSIYQNPLSQDFIVQNMYSEQPTNDPTTGLVGYFPIGYSIITTNELANFAPPPVPNGTTTATQQGNGKVTFEEVDESGEQSAFDAQRNGGRDALTPLSGAFSWQQIAFSRPTPGIAFDLRFGYSSANSFGGFQLGGVNPYSSGPMGNGWRNTFETRVIPSQSFSPLGDADTVGLMRWDGSIETWDLNYTTGQYQTRNGEYNGELVITTTNCQWTTPERLVYLFRRPDSGANFVMRGRLIGIQDFNSNSVQILWNQTSGVITQVVDSVNGVYNFNYQANLLTNVTFGSWQLNFAYDATNRLSSKSITNTAALYGGVNTTWQFQYGTNGLLAGIIDPRGNTNILIQYDQYGRQTNQMDAIGRATATLYETPGERQITRIDPATNVWVETYDRKGNILAQQDPLTNTTSYTYDTNNNRTSITEPLGWTTYFGYDDRANVIARTNALGEVATWVFHPLFNKPVQQVTPQPPDANGWATWTNFFAYDAGGNLTNHSDALGTLVSYTYSTNGLVLTSTDANTNTSSFAYDTNGFLIAKTDPALNTTAYLVNEVGWKLRTTDALGNPTSYTYDQNGNVTRIQDAISRVFNNVYDANGNLVSGTDGKLQPTTYGFDAANQKTNMVDRTGTNKWLYYYTSRGKLDHVTDALGYSVTNTYDPANRLVQVTDPLGHSVTNQYDANGNLVMLFDKTGQRWMKAYDRLNRVVAEVDPLGDAKNTAYDVADRIQQITSPNGYPSLHVYDGRGRLIRWVDPMNFPWLYAYDGVGNITNITDGLGGHYIMAYGSRNERTMEQNQDMNVWHYAYDELLHLTNQINPNGIIRTPGYDNIGRMTSVGFSTGRRDSFNYDNNDNPVSISRRASGVTTATQFIYDPLDRVVEQDDALGKTVLYGYDPLGRVASITYPGEKILTNNYDALGRLTNQVDWAGRQMKYTYDLADRLIRRTYPNGVVQTNVFDFAGRIIGLNYSSSAAGSNSINVALAYAYDRNGNKTGSGEIGTFNWPLPSLTDDATRFTPAGKLIARQTQNNSATSNQLSTVNYQYDPSGNMTNAVQVVGGVNAQSWTIAYDEDNRTTSILWANGALNDVLITNRYDVSGRRISKTVDGVTTGYVLLLAGGMEKVLCDLDGNGNVTAWYVHGPDLCYRVDTTNGLTCYHADAQANIIALSDGNTNLVAQYAYTPFGRSLGSTNFQTQISNPYLFVGSQGVQEEAGIPNLYFMRARYYFADAGVFLSTDIQKKIGPGWLPIAYKYAGNNPQTFADPTGLNIYLLGIQTSASASIGGGVQASDSLDMAIDVRHGQVGLFNTVCGGVQTGEGTDVSAELEAGYSSAHNLNELHGKSAYTSESGGALGRLSANQSIDSSGNVSAMGALGVEGGENIDYGGGECYTVPATPLEDMFTWAMNDPISANGGSVANSTPMYANSSAAKSRSSANISGQFSINASSTSGGGVSFNLNSGRSSMTAPTVNAFSFGNSLNSAQSTMPAPPTPSYNVAGTTPAMSGGGTASGSTTSQSSSSSSHSSATSSGTSSSGNFFTNAWNWFLGLF